MLEDYIMITNNALPNKLCEDIIKEYGDSTEWMSAGVGDGDTKRDVRNCEGISISEHEVIRDILARKEIDSQVHSYLTKSAERYFEKFSLAMCHRDTGYELLRYSVGGKYNEHIDYSRHILRNLTVSLILNDDYIGGEFSFFKNNIRYKLKRGDCIMFPSNFMFPHAVMPVIEGTRYSIVTWMF